MAKKKKELTDEELEKLDEYLQYKFNYDIYQELTEKEYDNFELFEPLEFFRVFHLAVDQIDENKKKPLSISKSLEKELFLYGEQQLTDEQRYFFYDKLLEWFSDEREGDAQIEICCREIIKLQENLDVYEHEEVETPSRQDPFDEVLAHLETLPTYKEQIAYLIQVKTKSEQKGGLDWRMPGEKSFAEQCQLEIEARRQLKQLEAKPERSADSVKKHSDLTLDRAALALNYLLTCAKANCHNTEKAKFISFLTGYSEKQIAQRLSRLHKKEDENYTAYERDMKIISQYFAKLGLKEITNQIEKDLKSE